jgi:hypothetical protein
VVGAGSGDCGVKLLVNGRVFRSVNVTQIPRLGDSVGTGKFAGCDGTPLTTEPRTARLFDFAGGGAPDQVVVTEAHGQPREVYVDQAIKPSNWPAVLREATHYQSCTGPAEFTGRWKGVDDVDLPDPQASGYQPDGTYHVLFDTTSGSGVGLDRWRRAAVRVRVDDTTIRPPTSDQLHNVGTDYRRWRVAAHCDGDTFVLDSMLPAR